ncbi:MAG: beta-ketoacyl-[acyl-carrier-protein] synthase family protein, partial [Actinomycetota bacterium]
EHRPPVTAGKSVHGHLIGAAGAVEAIATMLSVRNGSVPPIANLDNPDKTIEVDLVSGTLRDVVGAGLTNSFAFGGHNASLVIA